MAITGIVTVNQIDILEVDSDPSTGGGAAAPIGSLAILDTSRIWQKIGMNNTDWAVVTVGSKSGVATPGNFTGNPKKATITFSIPYTTTNYSIAITGGDSRIYTYESKTVAGFIINANANQALTSNVTWTTTLNGETV